MPIDDLPTLAAEAAATRRRWINLAEIVAVVGLLISGMALWNSYRERAGEESDKASARSQAQAQARTLILRGTADREGERLSLSPADPEQTIQSQTVDFPAALAVAPVETLADPRIEAGWFRREIVRATADDAEPSGDADRRVPVAIVTRFYTGGQLWTDVAVYYVVYRVEGGGLLEGRKVRLRGISRLATPRINERPAAQRRINEMWQASR
jgi:hypothetical protein